MAKKGRHAKYTVEVAEKLLTAIRAGNTRRVACAHAGISEDTLARWIKGQGGQLDGEAKAHFADFAEHLTRAEADKEVALVATIKSAAMLHEVVKVKRKKVPTEDGGVMVIEETTVSKEHDWHAAAWLLERMNPKDWAPRQKVELTGEEGKPIEVRQPFNLKGLSEDKLVVLEQLLAEAAAAA